MRLWEELGLAEEVGCQESREQKVKRFPELYLYVIVQVFARFGKISGRVWSSHGLYFGETVDRAKIPMARPNKP